MINIFIPLIFAIVLLNSRLWLSEKPTAEDDRVRQVERNKKIGWLLIGVSILYGISELMIAASHSV